MERHYKTAWRIFVHFQIFPSWIEDVPKRSRLPCYFFRCLSANRDAPDLLFVNRPESFVKRNFCTRPVPRYVLCYVDVAFRVRSNTVRAVEIRRAGVPLRRMWLATSSVSRQEDVNGGRFSSIRQVNVFLLRILRETRCPMLRPETEGTLGDESFLHEGFPSGLNTWMRSFTRVTDIQQADRRKDRRKCTGLRNLLGRPAHRDCSWPWSASSGDVGRRRPQMPFCICPVSRVHTRSTR